MNVLQRTQKFFTPKFINLLQTFQLANNSQTIRISAVNIFHRVNNFQLRRDYSYSDKIGHGSKYHPISPQELAELKLRELFFEKRHLTIEEWHDIKTDIMNQFLNITEENFDSILMNSLLLQNNIQLARSFLVYLDSISHKPNHVTCLKYMVLCSRHPNICKQDVILDMFDKVKGVVDFYPALDQYTVNCVVHGLCATDQWRKSFDYLKKLPVSNDPLQETKNALVCAAVNNGEEALAWDILTRWFKPVEIPSVNAINAYIKFAVSISNKNVQLADRYFSKLLLYLRDKNVVMKSECIEEIKIYFERHPHNWAVSNTKINRLGCCHTCSRNLESVNLSETELLQLQEAFFEKSIRKTDIYINSTSAELQAFLKYLERHKPFDIVVDGLNAAHLSNELTSRRTLAVQLLEVVKRLTVSSQKVLILGRRHMYKWPRNIMEAISKRASIFFTSNVSQEDPLVMYAALKSGPETLFVSSDLMRDHACLLNDPKMIQLFQKWQQSHQIYLSDSENGPVFKGPLKHHICIQGDMKYGWHIPYDDEFILDPYEVLNSWLCIQRIN